jgi:hypothetical protein
MDLGIRRVTWWDGQESGHRGFWVDFGCGCILHTCKHPGCDRLMFRRCKEHRHWGRSMDEGSKHAWN